jgi:ankyrin repeat protein
MIAVFGLLTVVQTPRIADVLGPNGTRPLSLERARELEEKGFDWNQKLHEGIYPLNLALHDIDTARYLLKCGAKVNVTTFDSSHLAQSLARNGLNPVSKLLVDAGADPNLGGIPPLFRAVKFGNTEAVKWLLSIGARASFEKPNALVLSVDRKSYEITELLLTAKFKANPNAHDHREKLPLSIASYTCDVRAVKLLLKHGAFPNKQRRFNLWTPLHAAVVRKGNVEVVKLLLAAGGDPNRKNHEGKTPLDYARAKGYADLVKLLEK